MSEGIREKRCRKLSSKNNKSTVFITFKNKVDFKNFLMR